MQNSDNTLIILEKYIVDTRDESSFRSATFSNYKKGDVTKELCNSLLSNQYEQCHYWCAEMICSGLFEDLWDTLIVHVGKHINLSNPKIPIYLRSRIEMFRDIARKNKDTDLSLRNNTKIRKLFAEVVAVLMMSKNSLSSQRVKAAIKGEGFDLMNISSKLKAPDVTFVKDFFKESDPKELFFAVNEMGFHLSESSRNAVEACFWMEWMFDYEVQTTKRKDKCVCAQRENDMVSEKYQSDLIWLIWDILLFYGSNNGSTTGSSRKALSPANKTKIIRALFYIFSLRYNTRVKVRRIQLLYLAINLITTSYIEDCDIIENKALINSYAENADLIYKEIKKGEIVHFGKEDEADSICEKILMQHQLAQSNSSSGSSLSSSVHKLGILSRGMDFGEDRKKERLRSQGQSKRASADMEDMSSMDKSQMKMNILGNVPISSLMLPSSSKSTTRLSLEETKTGKEESKSIKVKVEVLK